MSELRDRITEILRGQFPLNGNDVHAHVSALIAQAAEQHYRPRIETVEALKAIKRRPDLINGALIRVVGYPYFGAVLELNYDGTWNDLDATSAVGQRIAPDDIPLPVSLLWSPGADE